MYLENSGGEISPGWIPAPANRCGTFWPERAGNRGSLQ
jgi:hypothetical protein